MNVRKEKVNYLISQLDELMFNIKVADKYIGKLTDKEEQAFYRKQLDILLVEYQALCMVLKEQIEDYIRYERQNNLPVHFGFRLMLKRLNQ